MVLLPLKSDLGDVSRVLGCMVAQGDIGIVPRRFDVTDRQVMQIVAGAPWRPMAQPASPGQEVPQATGQKPASGMAEEASPFAPKSDKRRPPYLRLIKTDE